MTSFIGCDKRIIILNEWLEDYFKRKGTEWIPTSAKREGNGKSWHDKGLALDGMPKNSNIFKWVSELYDYCLKQQGAFLGVTEFEVVRGYNSQLGTVTNHLHFAFGNESTLETFTGVY